MQRWLGTDRRIQGAVALLFLALAQPASSAFPGDDGRIAFTRATGGAPAIQTVRADGSSLRTLARGFDPAWSPSGTRIAFVRSTPTTAFLATMHADGSRLRRVPLPRVEGNPTALSPSWSPDGRRIAYVRPTRHGIEPPFVLAVVSPGGRAHRVVYTSRQGSYLGSPAWSPDGRRILFTRTDSRIEVIDADGSNRRLLHRRPATGVDHPTWSPDGTRIAFAESGTDRDRILVMDADGTDVRVVAQGRAPAWSPSGARIAFVSPRGRLSVLTLATGALKRLAPHRAASVDWQPTR